MNNYYAGPDMMHKMNMGAGEYSKTEVKMSETNYNEAHTPAGMNNMPYEECGCPMPTQMCEPVYECPKERVCHRTINYEIPHIQPCNTRIVNHHVYRHTFKPCYTCCEENVVCNVYDNNNCC